jgi:hypothetical protein
MIRGNYHNFEFGVFLQQVAADSRLLGSVRCPEKNHLRAKTIDRTKQVE